MRRELINIVLFLSFGFSLFAQDNWRITSEGVGNIRIQDSIEVAKTKVGKNFTIKETQFGGFLVYYGNDRILTISPLLNTNKISSIQVLTDKFKTEDGLTIGLSIKEVKEKRPNFFLEYDEMSGSEYFSPPELQTPYSNVKVYFKGSNSDKLGDYKFNNKLGRLEKSTNNNEEGFIYLISFHSK